MAIARALSVSRCVVGTLVMAFSLQLCALSFNSIAFPLQQQRNDTFAWASFLAKLFHVKLQHVSGSLDRSGSVLYVCNHRSWADFFVDVLVTEGRACVLTRRAVVLAFPLLMLPAQLAGAIAPFTRHKRGAASQMLSSTLAHTHWLHSLLVYIEGTRNLRNEPLPLKSGAVRIAFRHRMRVQPVVTAGKERILNEQCWDARRNQTVSVVYGSPLDPSEYPDDEQAFVHAVHSAFRNAWSLAYFTPSESEPSQAGHAQEHTRNTLNLQPSLSQKPLLQQFCFFIALAISTSFLCSAIGCAITLLLHLPARPVHDGCLTAVVLAALMQIAAR